MPHPRHAQYRHDSRRPQTPPSFASLVWEWPQPIKPYASSPHSRFALKEPGIYQGGTTRKQLAETGAAEVSDRDGKLSRGYRTVIASAERLWRGGWHGRKRHGNHTNGGYDHL